MTSWRDRPLTWPMAAAGIGLAVAVSLLASCAAEAAKSSTPPGPIAPSPAGEWLRDRSWEVVEVRVGERTITCLYGSTAGGGVMSCDWGSK